MKTLNLPRLLQNLLATLTAAVCCGTPAVAQNVIRGTAPGWPGNTAYYAPQTVYQYAPAQAAPVVRAQYAPQPTTAYYAPASAARIAYAVPAAGSYQISYAGANQPGTATAAYYGGYAPPVQRVAYMPQQVYYAPQAAAPVTYYRVYQPAPVAAAPQTCGYAATTCQTSSCQTSSCGSGCGWSPWRPFAWLWRGSSSSCCKPQQTCNYGGCGQPAAAPYYVVPPTTAPVIPTVPAPIGSPFRSGTTISPPPTRSGPPGGTIINSAPADGRPALAPGSFGAPPAGTFGAPAPGGFAPAPAPGFNPPTTPGVLPDGTRDERFRPSLSDPYSQPAPTNNSPLMLAPPAASGAQIGGSPISGNGNYNERTNLIPQNRPNTISEPGFISPPSSVQPLNDPHGDERIQQNNNRAPQLITPGDRTAANGQRWGVIPAVWPVKAAEVQPVSKVSEPLTPVVAPTQLDDGGWKSAR